MSLKTVIEEQTEPTALHGRCNSSGAASLGASSADNDDDVGKRQSPRKNEGRVIVCHREALGVLVGATGFEPATSYTPCRMRRLGLTAIVVRTSDHRPYFAVSKFSNQFHGK